MRDLLEEKAPFNDKEAIREDVEDKKFLGAEIYNENKSMKLEFFRIQRDLALLMAEKYHELVILNGMDSYKMKHLVIEAFDIVDTAVTFSQDAESLELIQKNVSNIKHSDEFYDDDFI